MAKITRGEIWTVDLNPVRGHEQAGKRPCLVISVERLEKPWGTVSPETLALVEDRLRILMGL